MVGIASILLPSLLIPFAGIPVFAYRALLVGITLAPIDGARPAVLLPHSVTVLVEMQAYILLLLGAYLVGRAWLRPGRVGAETHRQGYVRGLASAGRVAVPAVVLLAIGAAYEALSLAYLVPWLLGR